MRIAAIGARLVSLTGLLAVASCAAGPPSSAPVPAASASGGATVLAVRPIAAAADAAVAWRDALLDGASGPARKPAAALAEFIVREDSGATISIVQTNDAALLPGDRVVVIHPALSAGRANLVRLL